MTGQEQAPEARWDRVAALADQLEDSGAALAAAARAQLEPDRAALGLAVQLAAAACSDLTDAACAVDGDARARARMRARSRLIEALGQLGGRWRT